MSGLSYEPARCVVCDRAETTLIADASDVARDIEALWAFHGRRLATDTPTNRLADRVTFSEHAPVRLVQCCRCGLVYRNPAERRPAVEAIYRDAPVDEAMLGSLHRRQTPLYRAQARRMLRALGRRGSVLEVGSYVGGFLAAGHSVGLTAEGLDINPRINAFARGLGYRVHDGDIATFEPSRLFDAVAIWNTFDQLADPRQAVHRAWTWLRPGGVLAIRVPNGEFFANLERRCQRAKTPVRVMAQLLLAENNLLGFPYRFGFSVGALDLLLRDVGFTPFWTRGDVLVPLADEWTRPWARIEEKALKGVLGQVARWHVSWAPWFESYARRP